MSEFVVEDEVIYIPDLICEGLSGPQIIEDAKREKIIVRDDVGRCFLSKDFTPSEKKTINIAILKGSIIKEDRDRTSRAIYSEAEKFGFPNIHFDTQYYLRKRLSPEDLIKMGLCGVVAMTGYFFVPFADYDKRLELYCVGLENLGLWDPDYGFSFDAGVNFRK